jgi:hypothetical protein
MRRRHREHWERLGHKHLHDGLQEVYSGSADVKTAFTSNPKAVMIEVPPLGGTSHATGWRFEFHAGLAMNSF